MGTYSKKIVSKTIEGRSYEIKKLGAKEVSIESFKLIKAITPSVGVGFDAMKGLSIFEMTGTTASAFQFLSDNLEVDHFSELTDKLLGSLKVDGVLVSDWDEYFSEDEVAEEHFIEILFWSFKENFYGFFTKSTILKPWINKAKEVVLPMMQEKLNSALNSPEQESNEKLPETEKSN